MNGPLFISIMAFITPIVFTIGCLFTEPELVEAIFGGIFFGSFFSCAFSIIALILDRGKNILTTVFSVVPMFPTIIYLGWLLYDLII